jgi:DNA-binding PadR family transcriptional regulator
LDDLEGNGMIERREDTIGRRTVAFYRPTQKGDIAFCRDILELYEKVFPRRKDENKQPTLHTGKRLSGFGSTHACVCPSVLTILSRLRQS